MSELTREKLYIAIVLSIVETCRQQIKTYAKDVLIKMIVL